MSKLACAMRTWRFWLNACSIQGSSAFGDGRRGSNLPPKRLRSRRQAADDRAQRRELVVEIRARSDLLRDDLVVLRLRVVGVGDRRRADLEIALGLRQVFADRRLLALGQLDVEPRQQHVEIGLGDADDQVLLRRRQHEIALPDLLLRLGSSAIEFCGRYSGWLADTV